MSDYSTFRGAPRTSAIVLNVVIVLLPYVNHAQVVKVMLDIIDIVQLH
jgi:hypothetical protein